MICKIDIGINRLEVTYCNEWQTKLKLIKATFTPPQEPRTTLQWPPPTTPHAQKKLDKNR